MDLTGKQRRHLRALAHHLNPVVMVGRSGLTDAVVASVDAALAQHELVKLRVDADAPEDRHEVAEALEARLHAACVQVIGHVLVLYRYNPEGQKIELPDGPKIPPKAAEDAPRGPTKRPLRDRRGPEAPAPTPRARATRARGPRSGS